MFGPVVERKAAPTAARNETGLPDSLKAGVESLAGMSLDNVRVHYNSSRPEAINALAYTQATDIHVAPGQERHLAHEAWHVVQQAQGRVRPTLQLKHGTPLNDDRALEREADVMGKRASTYAGITAVETTARASQSDHDGRGVVQACGNEAFNALVDHLRREVEGAGPSTEQPSSAHLAERSITRGTPAAFIVNAILPFAQVDRIPDVVNAMIEGLEAPDANRVTVVLGINAREEQAGDLDRALAHAANLIQRFRFPVALVRSTFRGDFPYGTMRNQVLHSRKTRVITEYFQRRGYHPYVSFQDFDTGSRRVGSEQGLHMFHAVDRVLAGRWDSDPMDDYVNPVRPLMIAGGYRPGARHRLLADTLARLRDAEIPDVDEADIRERLANFPELIAQDMRDRETYARLDPLLPYAPEPNLFIDATAAAAPSPLTGGRLAFGPGGAEYTALAMALRRYAAEEAEVHYAPQAQGKQLPGATARLLIDSQTNRHPQRGQPFYTDFRNLAVATDLSRLAYGYVTGTSPQSHSKLTTVTNRMFESKPAKKGVSLAAVRDEFMGSGDRRKYLESVMVQEDSESRARHDSFYRRRRAQLGGLQRQRLSEALSVPFSSSGPFSGERSGIAPGMAPFFAHQVALHSPLQEENAAILHQSVLDEARRIGADREFEIGHADGKDYNCTIISIFAAAGVTISAAKAFEYRQILIQEARVPYTGDITLTPAVALRILNLVTARTGETYELNDVHQDAVSHFGERPRHAVTVLANNGGGRPIYIFFAGAHFSPARRRQ